MILFFVLILVFDISLAHIRRARFFTSLDASRKRAIGEGDGSRGARVGLCPGSELSVVSEPAAAVGVKTPRRGSRAL